MEDNNEVYFIEKTFLYLLYANFDVKSNMFFRVKAKMNYLFHGKIG